MTEQAKATPAKEFFIRMLTRDIALDDCILDLVDNSIDGAKRTKADDGAPPDHPYQGFFVDVVFSEDSFRIEDNCGGISMEDARDYAFHFGRRAGKQHEPEESIGIYGIGLKRAVLKLGRTIRIQSSTRDGSFEVMIDVPKWEAHENWWFDLQPGEALAQPGTVIEIADLNRGVGSEFSDPTFINELIATIARDYSLFLQRGLSIRIGGSPVAAIEFSLRQSDEFQPAKIKFSIDNVDVEIAAGMAAPPPDPDEDLAQVEIKDVDRYGWFVLCNDRVVLAGDKSDRTVWGDDGYTRWHPQYNGFLGIASFRSEDPSTLPWTTTKRDVDETDPIYRQAVARMKQLTTPYIHYTNARKAEPEKAKQLEQKARPMPIADVAERSQMVVPSIEAQKRVKMGNVLYRRPQEVLRKAGEALGSRDLAYKEIGERTFEYFYEREVED